MRLAGFVLPLLTASLAVAGDDKPKPAAPTAAFEDGMDDWWALSSSSDKVITPARFAFGKLGVQDTQTTDDVAAEIEHMTALKPPVFALAADGKAGWFAFDVGWVEICGDETCPKKPRTYDSSHFTGVAEAPAWTPVAYHLGLSVTAKDQALAMTKGPLSEPFAKKIAPGADEVATLFASTIGDPARLAASVSPRKDVVLYGSAQKERFVGGKKVAATLQKWKLGFRIVDGPNAGVTTSGTVAWVAANLDAVPVKKPAAKATPYRALAIYEKVAAGWQVVSLQFSFLPN